MKRSLFSVALVVGLTVLGGSAHAQRSGWGSDDLVVPGVRLGLGAQFAANPNSTMLTGQFLLAADVRVNDGLGLAAELGYSGERRGRLAGRHLVFGGAVRFGKLVGLSPLVHGMIGRTYGESLLPTTRSGGLRVGGRVDILHAAGVDIQYEYRFLHNRQNESGFRVVFWFDALIGLKVVGFG